MKIRSLMFIFMTLAMFSPAWAQDKNEDLAVHNAWVRWQPPSRPNSSAFMTIENKSKRDISVISVSSKVIEHIELHAMERENGIMKMRQINRIVIPANSGVELKPGGLHLMLFGIQKPLEAGEKLPMTLNFPDGSMIEFEAVVKGQDEE